MARRTTITNEVVKDSGAQVTKLAVVEPYV